MHHKYWYGGRELASVSSVIRTVYNKKTWDGVDEAVVENARIRGSLVDDYFSEYLRTGFVDIPEGERMDVLDRVIIAHKLFKKHFGDIAAIPQVIVFSLEDGVAGTVDIDCDDLAIDLKATYSPEPSWILQLGAYIKYKGAKRGAILHVSPKLYKNNGGGKVIHVDADEAVKLWDDALVWWKRTKDLENAIKKAKRV